MPKRMKTRADAVEALRRVHGDLVRIWDLWVSAEWGFESVETANLIHAIRDIVDSTVKVEAAAAARRGA